MRFTRVGWKIHKLKSLYDGVISVVDEIFDQWDPSVAAPTENVCGP